jgi:hypothetical protein
MQFRFVGSDQLRQKRGPDRPIQQPHPGKFAPPHQIAVACSKIFCQLANPGRCHEPFAMAFRSPGKPTPGQRGSKGPKRRLNGIFQMLQRGHF